jgi:hypothetical protein
MRISLMEKINDMHLSIERSGQKMNDGITFSIEVDENNMPTGILVKQSGNPMVLLGLYELLLEAVQEHKDKILDKFNTEQKLGNLIGQLPGDLGAKIKALEIRMRKAVAEHDDAEIAKIQLELDQLLNSSRNDLEDMLRKRRNSEDGKGPDEGGFSIKDFLGGL